MKFSYCIKYLISATLFVNFLTASAAQAPLAISDNASNPGWASVINSTTISNIISNDSDVGGFIDTTTIDLDLGTAGVQDTLTTIDGVWQVTQPTNKVVFAPNALFSSANKKVTRISYVVNDNEGNTSNAANLTIIYQNDNLIVNGSFEADDFLNANDFPDGFTSEIGTFIGNDYNSNTITGWDFTTNLDGWVGDATFGSNFFASAQDGKQYIDIMGNNIVHGSGSLVTLNSNVLSQIIDTEPGKPYSLSFYWGEDIGHSPPEIVTAHVKVIGSDSTVIIEQTLNKNSLGAIGNIVGPKSWELFSQNFVATSNQTTIQFSTTPPGSGDTSAGAGLDNISVTKIPVPVLIVDNITSDNTINTLEAGSTITITGKVTGDFNTGDTVTLSIYGSTYSPVVNIAGIYSIDVVASNLVSDTTIDANITTTNVTGNTNSAFITHTHHVDTVAATLNSNDISVTSNATPNFSGTTDQPDGSLISVKNSVGDILCTTTALSGLWNCTSIVPLSFATHNLTVETTDDANNVTIVLFTAAIEPDTDNDGILDGIDIDDDNDGILDIIEQNSAQNGGDTDGDGTPDDLDLDSDADGISDLHESGLKHGQINNLDINDDGVIDELVGSNGLANSIETDDTINAGADYNTDHVADTPVDTDNDSQPDFQDIDADNDGINDLIEGSGLNIAVFDANNNGVIDNFTLDSDNDGIADSIDTNTTLFGGISNTPVDTDNDNQPDYRDTDSDGDGIYDLIEGTLIDTTPLDIDNNGTIDNIADSDHDGVPDVIDGDINQYGNPQINIANSDNDPTPDYIDLDSDNDSLMDVVEAGHQDDDGDALLDQNGSLSSTIKDIDNDGIEDFRDLDSDANGINDIDNTLNHALDADKDGVIDDPTDSDNDGIANVIDYKIGYGQFTDTSTNGQLETAIPSLGGAINLLWLFTISIILLINKRYIHLKATKHYSPYLLATMVLFTTISLTISENIYAKQLDSLDELWNSYESNKKVTQKESINFNTKDITKNLENNKSKNTKNSCNTRRNNGDSFTACNYAAIGGLITHVSPEKETGGWSTSNNASKGYNIIIGRQFKPRWFGELSYSDMGKAELSNSAPGITNKEFISYKVPSAHIGYLFKSPAKEVNAYVKGGLSAIKNKSSTPTVPFRKVTNIQTTFGVGLQWKSEESGLFSRIGADFYGQDAIAAGLMLGYQFGAKK